MLKKLIDVSVSLFTQKRCFGCQQPGHFFCQRCNDMLYTYQPYCYVCKKGSENFSVHNVCQKYFYLKQIVVLTRYRNTGIKKLLRHAKFYNAYPAYKDIIIPNKDFFLRYITTENSILVPVPMHFFRKWKRGYNQTDIITHSLSETLGIPAKNYFLKRSKYTVQQSHLSASSRSHNLDNAFMLGSANVDLSMTIYLVDDVISTGSTLNEIALFLRKNGYKDVRAIVLASD